MHRGEKIMADDIDLRRTMGVMTDEERFRILASVSLGANTVEKIAAMTGYDNQAILKAILKLETAGLVEKKENAGYTFNIGALRAANRSLPQNAVKKSTATELGRFMKQGKLITYPKAPKDKLLVLNHIIELFEYGRPYPEKEVNEKIQTIHPDFASMRRYLFDGGFFSREHITEKDGHTTIMYWRVKHL
jgi:hypothetical protein